MPPSSSAASISTNKDPKLDFLKECFRGDIEAVKSAIEAGADVNWTDGFGYTGLMVAKTPEILELLIKCGANVNAANLSGQTALMDPGNNLDVIQVLVDAGADVNAACKIGKTALMFTKTPAAVALLLKAGADVNARDNSNTTALIYAVTKDHNSYAQYRHSDEEQHQTIKLLIEAGAWINYRRKGDRKTALMLARFFNDVVTLVEAGADVTLKDSERKLAHQQDCYKSREPELINSYLESCFESHLLKQSALSAMKEVPSNTDNFLNNRHQRL